MAAAGERQFALNTEWLDPHSSLLRKLHLTFYEVDGTLQLHDVGNNRVFLKRCIPPERVVLTDLFVGNTITVYSRKLKITGFGDKRTEVALSSATTRAVAVAGPSYFKRAAAVLDAVAASGLTLGKVSSVTFTPQEAAAYGKLGGGSATGLVGGTCLAMELTGPSSIETAQELKAVLEGVVVSPSVAVADKQADFLFDQPRNSGAVFRDCAVGVLRPHILASGQAPAILQEITDAGFAISAIRTISMNRQDAADFLDLYKGVTKEYSQWVDQLCSAQAMVIEVVGSDCVHNFRQLCGPYNVQVAQTLRPASLRAKYGIDNVSNAIHCTDLANDGPLESKFMFEVAE